jgi:uncharacterized protein YjbI with pentapeptide repeats
MANKAQLKILKQGVDVWNAWRGENIDTKIDLKGADLSKMDLTGIDLSDATLFSESPREDKQITDPYGENKVENEVEINVDLRGVDLRQSILREATLRGADLSNATLIWVDLTKADLSATILKNTICLGATLDETNLRLANLDEVVLQAAHITDVDLNDCRLHKADLSSSRLVRVNLNGAQLEQANLQSAYLAGVSLEQATLRNANLRGATLSEANLNQADLMGADLSRATLTNAILTKAQLPSADLSYADLNGADLSGAYLVGALLLRTSIDQAKVSGSSVYGISVWDLQGEFAEQKDLIITRGEEPILTVDNLRVAQFLYLILNNEELRDVINTVTSKLVLILGRFADENRKAVLDAVRKKLREYSLLPVVFDFDRPIDRDFTEMVQTLAGLSLFVIIDITNPKSTPLEMEAIVKHFKIPYVPILDLSADKQPFSMIVDLQKNFHWVLPTYGYQTKAELLDNIEDTVINRALDKHNELREQKAREVKVLTLADLKKENH